MTSATAIAPPRSPLAAVPQPLPPQPPALRSEGLQYVHRVTRVLTGRPDEQRLLRTLVLDFPARFHAVAGLLAHCFDDGTLSVAASFGYPDGTSFPSPFPLSEDWPISRAARTGEPFCLPTSYDVLRTFPLMRTTHDAGRPLALTQLTSMGSPVGVVVIAFDSPVTDVPGVLELMGAVRDVVGLYAGLEWDHGVRRTSGAANRAGRRATDPRLTDRQLQVLELLAQGYGNGQIAHRIGYSESTVRHETMAIYRWFGVPGRREAVTAARERGVLPPE